MSPQALARDEGFWGRVRAEYATPADFTFLEFGTYHPCTNAVLARQIDAMKVEQRRGSHYKRDESSAVREMARAALARLAGADSQEVVVTRNSTESLNIAIQGMPLSPGDGIVHSDQDFPSAVEILEQRAARDRLELQVAHLPPESASDDEIIASFSAAISARTRAILITHLINHSGQVLPLRKLCSLGRAHGLLVVVDAAHSFAQLDFTLQDVDCDYFVASLHKWLGAPLGTGLLYVRRGCVGPMTPFFADTTVARSDIRKLEHFGNRPDSTCPGLIEAVRWHRLLGTAYKGARLHYLQRRWSSVARSLPGLHIVTPRSPERHGAIGTFFIDGMDPAEVVRRLWSEHRIFVKAVGHARVQGVRVTPGLPTLAEDIDRLIQALHAITQGIQV